MNLSDKALLLRQELLDGVNNLVPLPSNDDGAAQKLEVFSAAELQNMALGDIPFIVKSFLHQGLVLLSAAPKIGKSFLMILLCLSVVFGIPFLGFETVKSGVAYLALEDSKRRLQKRIRLRLGSSPWPDNFYLATVAPTLDAGLSEQLRVFMREHPDVKLMVIDVLERVRASKTPHNKNAYQVDSAELVKLKNIADEHDLCLIAVHHNRKSRDQSDSFLNISGSQGILGAVDQAFTIEKENRSSNEATLRMVSRELGDEEWIIRRPEGSPWWEMGGTTEEERQRAELAEYQTDPAVITINSLLALSPWGVELTASQFFAEMGLTVGRYGGHTPSTLGKYFLKIAPQLLEQDNILHEYGRSKNLRKHVFKYRASSVSSPSLPLPPSLVSL